MNTPEAQNEVLRDCTKRLEQLGIAYMLTGSMAPAHYAIQRVKADIDIVLEISKEAVQNFIQQFEPDYYISHGRIRDAISSQRMSNILNQANLIKVDCVVRKNNKYQQTAFERRKKVDYAGFEVRIISREDLILSKLNWTKIESSGNAAA